jgi:hypothetical protein
MIIFLRIIPHAVLTSKQRRSIAGWFRVWISPDCAGLQPLKIRGLDERRLPAQDPTHLSATSGNSTLPICSRWNVCFTSPSRRSKLTTEAGAIHVFEVGEGKTIPETGSV